MTTAISNFFSAVERVLNTAPKIVAHHQITQSILYSGVTKKILVISSALSMTLFYTSLIHKIILIAKKSILNQQLTPAQKLVNQKTNFRTFSVLFSTAMWSMIVHRLLK